MWRFTVGLFSPTSSGSCGALGSGHVFIASDVDLPSDPRLGRGRVSQATPEFDQILRAAFSPGKTGPGPGKTGPSCCLRQARWREPSPLKRASGTRKSFALEWNVRPSKKY